MTCLSSTRGCQISDVIRWLLQQGTVAQVGGVDYTVRPDRGVVSGWFTTQVLDSSLLEGLVRVLAKKNIRCRVIGVGDDVGLVLSTPQAANKLRAHLMPVKVVNPTTKKAGLFRIGQSTEFLQTVVTARVDEPVQVGLPSPHHIGGLCGSFYSSPCTSGAGEESTKEN